MACEQLVVISKAGLRCASQHNTSSPLPAVHKKTREEIESRVGRKLITELLITAGASPTETRHWLMYEQRVARISNENEREREGKNEEKFENFLALLHLVVSPSSSRAD